jgi:adenylate cyclase
MSESMSLASVREVDFFREAAAASLLGALLVLVFLGFVVPLPDEVEGDWELFAINAGVLALYLLIAVPLGIRRGRALAAPINAWLEQGVPPTTEQRDQALAFSVAGYRVMGPLWATAALLFAVLNAFVSLGLAAIVGVAVALGGLTTCTLVVLLAQRRLREVIASALEEGVPEEPIGPGVGLRIVLAWGLGTAIPLAGIVVVAATELLGADLSGNRLALTIVVLGALALSVGLAIVRIAGRSVAGPVEDVRSAIARVELGDLDAHVRITDGSEVGLLAAGFNRMVAGLRERERLREAFGRFVDPSLTERVLAEGTDLAGEEVELSVMFVDVRGFTTFAETAEAHEVVARLNELYGLVVPIILRHEGHASKFIGDGLLAVFGAPERLPDHARRAVSAALEIARSVRERYGEELRVGVGVNSGRVVAGTIGGGGRLDFTVIGDPVNTAARVEAATRQTDDDVLITEATRALVGGECGEWEDRPPIPLKGKSAPVALYAPSR